MGRRACSLPFWYLFALPHRLCLLLSSAQQNNHATRHVYHLLLHFYLRHCASCSCTVLAELRLFDMEIDKIAKPVALVNEIFGVALLVFAISLAQSQTAFKTSIWVILSSTVYIVFCFFVVRPGIAWLARSTPKDKIFSNFTTSIILAGVMIFGFITDSIGVHPTFGAFVFGLVFPTGPLAASLVERLQDFITASTWVTILYASILSSACKVAGTVLVALFLKMPFQEGVALGLLMNSKGLIESLGLNLGKDQKVIDDTAYAIMVVATRVTLVVSLFNPSLPFPLTPQCMNYEEICNLAEDKRVAFIIVPFHKQPTVDGGMESDNLKIRMLNQNVSHNTAVLFFGGVDDIEALSYAVRMSEHPGNTLKIDFVGSTQKLV
ncbi:cation/hydrogen exchanger 15 [Actinidia rufa]|uniref:Cation/hydrogen exchanger 15 n=1 Tax=Actinidia rufa TaxID=165716 RepID=A0A7J0E228_9ERIC|nr:cation/hydrogen exchanger 15 [Actinidia rufa]